MALDKDKEYTPEEIFARLKNLGKRLSSLQVNQVEKGMHKLLSFGNIQNAKNNRFTKSNH